MLLKELKCASDGSRSEMGLLTHRDRVLMAIQRKQIDRVPMDMGGQLTGPAEVPAIENSRGGYSCLARSLNIDVGKPEISSFYFVLNFDERILERFDIDIRHIMWGFEAVPQGQRSELIFDEFGVGYRSMGYFNQPVSHPLLNAKSIKEVEEYSWPDPHKLEYLNAPRLRELEKRAKYLHEETDYAVLVEPGFLGYILGMYSYLVGWNRALTDMRLNPALMKAVCNRVTEIQLEMIDALYGAIGDYADIACVADDLGTQRGPMMSLQQWTEFFRPDFARVINRIRKHTKATIFMHNDGSIVQYLDDLAEVGVGIINPIQPLASKMNPEYLKENFGSKLCFHGGIDVQRLLPSGTVQEVRREVERTISILAPGYILAPSHLIGPDVPPENIVAMYDTAREFHVG